MTQTLLPNKTFYRLCPELYQGGLTNTGTPVRVQLLGSDSHWLAENAQRAIALGSQGIDLNCGCPAKTVVGHEGGASLLKQPERIYRVTQAMRQAVGDHPLSVKIRLGWDNCDQALEIADAVQQGGANEIFVHGRTKVDGYRAEQINWEKIAEIAQRLTINVIANGEITDVIQAQRCRMITGCQDLMVGRGALARPNLGQMIRQQQPDMTWQQILELLFNYLQTDAPFDSGFYHVARVKQWLSYLKIHFVEANALFRAIRMLTERHSIIAEVEQQLIYSSAPFPDSKKIGITTMSP